MYIHDTVFFTLLITKASTDQFGDQFFLKCISDCGTFFDFQENNPGVFTVNINNTQQESYPLIVYAY